MTESRKHNAGERYNQHPQDKFMEMLEQDLTNYTRLVFLENFASEELSEDMERTIRANLQRCHSLPLVLTGEQKALLVEPYM